MSATFIIILVIAVLLAVVGVSMNRSRTRRDHSAHGAGLFTSDLGTDGPSHSAGEVGSHAASHDGGGSDGGWGDSGSGGDGGGGGE